VEDACRAEEPPLLVVEPDHATRCRRWEVLAEGGATDLFAREATGSRGSTGSTGNDIEVSA
jgi:hypothetical protein